MNRSFAAHVKASDELLLKHPELLQQAHKTPRRAHPGLAAMSCGGATTDAAAPPVALKPTRRVKAAAKPVPAPRRGKVTPPAAKSKATPSRAKV